MKTDTTPDEVDEISKAVGFETSENLSTMRRELYEFLEQRGWNMTGSGVGESHYTDARCIDVSAKKGTKHIIVEIHEMELSS